MRGIAFAAVREHGFSGSEAIYATFAGFMQYVNEKFAVLRYIKSAKKMLDGGVAFFSATHLKFRMLQSRSNKEHCNCNY